MHLDETPIAQADPLKKERIIRRLKENGFRITKQRQLLLDVILEGKCTSCKEIYYRVSRIDNGIGAATVYRMINTLEGIGAISRKNMYQIRSVSAEEVLCGSDRECVIELDDDTVIELENEKWTAVMRAGLKDCGYLDGQGIRRVRFRPKDIETARADG